jgi:hypothetical protein
MGISGKDYCFIYRVAELAAGTFTNLLDGQVPGNESIFSDTGDLLVMLFEDRADDLCRGPGIE